MDVVEDDLSDFFATMLPLLDERERRLLLGATAVMFGRGGQAVVTRAAEVSRNTVITGMAKIANADSAPSTRTRRPGAGRKKAIDLDPELLVALDELVEPESRGDPMSPLRWTAKSVVTLTNQLNEQGFEVGTTLVHRLLKYLGYALQAPAKEREGNQHADRDAQFHYLNDQVTAHQRQNQPVISVDTKKKELIGNYDNGGVEYQQSGEPIKVNVHDFPDPEMGKAVPYGVYDLASNEGWVSVGDDGDTAAFAVESIRRWWFRMGIERYPKATKLMINADGGGSNGYKVRLWKTELAKLAAETGLEITVSHLPPGTSKWNKIEHRMFSFITMNWRGRPLDSYRTVVSLIANTTTRKGLKINAELDQGHYPRGIKITDKELRAVPLRAHDFHGEWNYTISPTPLK